MRIMANTSKDFPCTQCGNPGNIIRENVSPELRKLKCLTCGFMYTEADSSRAVEAGEIPDEPPTLQPEPVHDQVESPSIRKEVRPNLPTRTEARVDKKLPRTLSYVVVSKDRSDYTFTTKKGLKQVIFQWETDGKKYEVFELTPKAVTAKVDIQ